MSGEMKDLHDKIEALDGKFDGLHTQQALISQSVEAISIAIEKLVDLRAETISIMVQLKSNKDEHDEIFSRLRKGEVTQVACKKTHEATEEKIEDLKENRIKPMEDNQKWVVRVVIGALLLAGITLVVTHA